METYDAVVIGGGAAGLSAGIALARSRRSVLVIDAGEPRNAPAEGVHNLLGQEGLAPAELVKRGRAELESYAGRVHEGRAVSAAREGETFTVTLEDGSAVAGRRLVVTTGLVDRLPQVPGLAAQWGRDVLHCPYCHGWEVRCQVIGVLATGVNSVQQALLFSQLSEDVTLLRNDLELDGPTLALLGGAGVAVVDGHVEEVLVAGGRLSGVRLQDGREVALQALVVAPYMVARSEVLTSLGVATVAHPAGMGEHVEVDEMGQTSVPGVYAAGNVVDLSAQVMGAAAAGTRAGAAVNADLVMTDARERIGA